MNTIADPATLSEAFKRNARRRKLRLTMQGGTITLSLGAPGIASWIIRVTDTAITGAGVAGISTRAATTATTGIHFEDFRVGAL